MKTLEMMNDCESNGTMYYSEEYQTTYSKECGFTSNSGNAVDLKDTDSLDDFMDINDWEETGFSIWKSNSKQVGD